MSEHSPGTAMAVREPGHRRRELIGALFRQHHRSLLRFLRSKLRSAEEAADAAQEAYVRMLQLEAPEAVSYLRAFLFTTAARIAIDRLRTRKVEARRLEQPLLEPAETRPGPEQAAADAETLRLVSAYIRELPPRVREALLLRRIEGLSCAEIAARLQIPERTVYHYIAEALLYCRSRLDRAAPPKPLEEGCPEPKP